MEAIHRPDRLRELPIVAREKILEVVRALRTSTQRLDLGERFRVETRPDAEGGDHRGVAGRRLLAEQPEAAAEKRQEGAVRLAQQALQIAPRRVRFDVRLAQ